VRIRVVSVQAEMRIMAAEPLARALVIVVLVGATVVGFMNGATRPDVMALQATVSEARRTLAVARADGVEAVDGVPVEDGLRSLDAAAARSSLDLHYGSFVGAGEAILGLAATLPGALGAVFVGAVLVGRDFERRTWFYELSAGSRRVALARKCIAGILSLGGVLGAAVITGSLGALVGSLSVGSFFLGAVAIDLVAKTGAVLLLLGFWLILGMATGLVATRVSGGVAAAALLLFADAAISLNLATWGPYLSTPRVTGLARMWAPTSQVFLATGETTSLIWWGAFTGVPGYGPLDGAVVIGFYAVGAWMIARLLIHHVPWQC
jgi:hypothetical protein